MLKKTILPRGMVSILLLFVLAACSHPTPLRTVAPSSELAPALVTTAPQLPAPTPSLLPSQAPRSTALSTPAVTAQPLSVSVIEISAPALKGNLLGDPTTQAVQVILPPSYEQSDRRYPVVYFLPGFGSVTNGEHAYYLLDDIAVQIARGVLAEMILVVPNGGNRLGGSFYVNSPVSGNWEDFIVEDVVGYIDSHYRTLAQPESRGIAGHSMGGFGALNLAMHHPDIFSAVFAESPGFLDETGLSEIAMFDTPERRRLFYDKMIALTRLPDAQALQEMGSYEGNIQFMVAYGVAFAPHADLGAPFFDYPYQLDGDQLKRLPAVWQRWQDGLGGWAEKIKQYHPNLARLHSIRIDYGLQDKIVWLRQGSDYVYGLLTQAGLPVQITRFEGGHNDRIEERLLTVMLPYFTQALSASP